MLAAAAIETHKQCIDGMNIQAQQMRSSTEETPSKSADISGLWLSDVIAMLHAVAGNLSEDNRILALAAQQLILDAPRIDNASDGVWHNWLGGECPVGAHDTVQVEFRDGTFSGPDFAGSLGWNHDGGGTDIISYIVVERHHGSEN